jgi:hypothetical protein
MKYSDLSIETAFVIYHTKHIASVCDGDTKETREIKEVEE